MAPKIAIAIFSLAFIGAVFAEDKFDCYKCDRGSDCPENVTSTSLSIVPCNSTSFCYVESRGDKYFRGCESVSELLKKQKGGANYTMVCNSPKCNDLAKKDLKCYTCKDCRNTEKTNAGLESCPLTSGPYLCTSEESDDGILERGCTNLMKLEKLEKHVKEVCSVEKCNNKDFGHLNYFECNKCDDCIVKEEKVNCTTSNEGCYTRISDTKVIRGCSLNSFAWANMKTETEKQNGTLHTACKTDSCNSEKLYKCVSCTGKDKCKEAEVENVICASTEYGCYTQTKGNETVAKGCADDKAQWDKLTADDHKVIGPCKEELCNKVASFECYECKGSGCKTVNATSPKVNCTMNNSGCYILLKGDEVTRGCVKNDTEWTDLIKDNSTKASGPCKTALCNGEENMDCYSCEDENKCKNPGEKDSNITTTACLKNFAGCYQIFDGPKTIRGCAKNQTDIDDLKKKGGQEKDTCKETKCNKLPNPNASPGIQGSPTIVISIAAVLGAYMMNY